MENIDIDKENLPKEEPSDVLSDIEQERELKDEN